MAELTAVASLAGNALLLLTAVSSSYAAWRRRDAHRLDILLLVGSMAVVPWLRQRQANPALYAVGIALLVAYPYFLLRLIRHLRDVPAILNVGALVVVGMSALAYFAWPAAPSGGWNSAMLLYIALLTFYAALAFTREARRTSGVTAGRLVFAGAGSWLFATGFLIAATAQPSWGRLGGQINQLLNSSGLACYFFAFNTPRVLRGRWQRNEQAKYLSDAADRGSEERGAHAADDLFRGTLSSVGQSMTMVALSAAPGDTTLVVRAASDESLRGLQIRPGDGLVGRACSSGEAQTDVPERCEDGLGGRLTPFGARVLVAPVATSASAWGIVLVVQRRGSLFPEDDLKLLAQLARYAATALDHAHLIVERRERDRRAAERRLREVETRMSLMLDSIKDYAMFVLDQEGRVAAWHVGAEHVFGYAAHEVTDESAAHLYNMAPADFAQLLDDARRRGHAQREGLCRRRDGAKFIGTTIIRPLAGEAGDPPGFAAVTRDVTERRELEDRLRQSQKLEAIGRLAGGIAHDFNNMLTAIIGHADYLASDLAPDDPQQEEVAEILKAAERAAGLTRQLLSFSRRQMLQQSPINLSTLIVDLLPMLRRVIGEHVGIIDETSPGVSPILGDRNQVEQVIVNLAVNARDAMPLGGQLRIRTADVWLDAHAVRELSPGAYVLLEVADTGMGMDAETRSHIFEPFFTTKEVGTGTGLGLSTVYGIVSQMGGSVRVESELTKGTTFQVYFPEARGREVAVAAPTAAVAPPRGNETLLLVEDDDAVRTFLEKALIRHGYRVLAADHPVTARTLVEATDEPIHLVITDVVLPNSTGPELVQSLGALRPGLLALYISGYADGVLTRQGAFAKASHFLQKPFSAADLLLRIRQILPTQ